MTEEDEPVQASPRSFGIVFAAVFMFVGLAPLWHQAPVRAWSLAVATAFFIFAIAAPAALRPLSHVWQRVGLLLHHIVNPVVMGVLYYVVLTPFGLVMRLFGRGLSRDLAPDVSLSSYWRSRTDSPAAGMRHQF
jgi:hypothetical protein